ncbi:MAG: hypothetical protein ABI692_17230 [Terracoccus sp.]
MPFTCVRPHPAHLVKHVSQLPRDEQLAWRSEVGAPEGLEVRMPLRQHGARKVARRAPG